MDEMANENWFKKNAQNYNILHLAMHALIDDEDPLRSKLLFSQTNDSTEDGFLNAYELYNMKINADLVVLSACNTGYGKLVKGEGVMSLSRAFMYAGCPSIVMSLWKAEDKSTASIMVNFFRHIKQGEFKDEALRNSKLNFIQNADPLTAHPFFWANFVVVGDNSPIDTTSYAWIWIILIVIIVIAIIGGIYYYSKSSIAIK
jgi:CHAT domain-containing protein